MAEEGTDHGEVLTKFEEIFGSLVEHEVIKMVLQSCDWDSIKASDMILGMIDQEQLPPHVRNALMAGTVVRGVSTRFSPPASVSPIQDQDSQPVPSLDDLVRDGASSASPSPVHQFVERTDGAVVEDLVDVEGENPQVRRRDSRSGSRNSSPCLTNRNTTVQSGRPSHSSVITPFAMAQGALAREPYIDCSTQHKSWSMAPTLPLHSKDEEKEIVDALPSDNFNETDSDSLSPRHSPDRHAALDFETNCVQDTSQWVLAPEFIPNALHQTKSNAARGFWPVGPSRSFSSALGKPFQPFNGIQNGTARQSKKDEIVGKILEGKKIVVLMRGLPGSGKSTLAKEIKSRSGVILSADDFFHDKFGNYNFEPHKLREAHSWNMNRARIKLQDSRTPIIIDNTNLQVWEMQPYVKLALQHGYDVDILEPETSWKVVPRELAKRNIHGVPKAKIKEMKGRYDPSITIDHVISSLQDVGVHRIGKATVESRSDHCVTPKTEWPATLPDSSGVDRKAIENGVDINPTALGHNAIDDRFAQTHEDSESVGKLINANSLKFSSHNGLSCNLDTHGKTLEEDDPDVIIEGYEDSEDSDYDATACENTLSPKRGEKRTLEGSNKIQQNISSTNIADALSSAESNKEMENEDRLRALIEEANMDIDDEFVTDWDDLAKDVNEEDMSDEKFNELVNTFGSSVRYELEKSKGTSESVKPLTEEASADVDDDSAMYELCSDMEDKIGYSLSSAIMRPNSSGEPSSLFSIINSSDLGIDDHNTASEGLSEASFKKDSVECFVPAESNDGDGLSIDFVKVSNLDKDLTALSRHALNTLNGTEVNENKGLEILHNSEENKSFGSSHSLVETNMQSGDVNHELFQSKLSQAEEPANTMGTKSGNDDRGVDVTDSENGMEKSGELLDKVSSPSSCHVSSNVTSWDCVNMNDDESSVNWDSSKPDDVGTGDSDTPKPTRGHRRRTSGDPNKWLLPENEDTSETLNSCGWEPVKEGMTPSWDSSEENKHVVKSEKGDTDLKPQPHTGAVPKMRISQASQSSSRKHTESGSDKTAGHSNSSSPLSTHFTNELLTKSTVVNNDCKVVDGQTQTLSLDFEALELDNNLYELKILYGQPNYVPKSNSGSPLPDCGPLTKGKLLLDKGTITENIHEPSVAKPLKNLVAFFPNIPEADLKDVLEKCKYDVDWAMNVLLDGGYEMAELVDACDSQEDSEVEDAESHLEPVNACDTNEKHSVAGNDISDDIPLDEKSRRIRQSQQPVDLNCKKEIESAFTLSETVDDRVTRLTGKDFDSLNINKIKKKKSKKKHSKKKHHEEAVNWAEGGGAQYVTLVMDSLFASQLINMFGPVGSCEMSGDMIPEDRSVILPLELCHQIHKYWTHTLDGKFNHEAEVLDSLMREDENLARRLQQEEDLASQSTDYPTTGLLDDPEKVFQNDPPSNFKEIMDLEQALQDSQVNRSNGNAASMSSHLSLQRLYTEFPHIDPEALKREYDESGFNYQDTVIRLCNRYGSEQGEPKTVIAPERLLQYEQELILKAQQESLAQQELEEAVGHQDDDEYMPDNPQVYRDEAQTHYLQRNEFYRKAQEAHRQGMKAVAAYYASIGKLHSEKLREANQRASVKILEAVNSKKDANVLDLHLLHVPEALSAAQAFMSEREQLLAARGINRMQISIITGRGAHSKDGQARLKPAIKDFLQKKGYMFYEANSGMFEVTMLKK